MSRVTFNRFKVAQPAQGLLDQYLRVYPARTIHFEPRSLPAISSPSLFKNDHPLFLDLGCGVGDYTIQFALDHPQANIIGIDHHYKSLHYALNQLTGTSIQNILFIRSDLRFILKLIPDSSADGVFLLFPPPPTKPNLETGHFFNQDFVSRLHHILKLHAEITFITDNPIYLEQKSQLFSPSMFTQKQITDTSAYSTRFHKKWLEKGITTQGKTFSKQN